MIPGVPVAAIRAVQADAERTRAEEEAEEERMTPYDARDLEGGWEFKIIRSPRGLFGRPEFRDRVLGEEGRGWWVLVEVFDDARIRLKRRPAGAMLRAIDGYDPYRTVIPDLREPLSPEQKAFVRLSLVILLLAGVFGTLAAAGVFR
jgi:hypothetical protein